MVPGAPPGTTWQPPGSDPPTHSRQPPVFHHTSVVAETRLTWQVFFDSDPFYNFLAPILYSFNILSYKLSQYYMIYDYKVIRFRFLNSKVTLLEAIYTLFLFVSVSPWTCSQIAPASGLVCVCKINRWRPNLFV